MSPNQEDEPAPHGEPPPAASAQTRELLSFLGRRDLARLWPEVRGRLERFGQPRGTVRLSGATEAERQAVAGLFGLPIVPDGELRVRLDHLDRALRASRFATDLRTAMTLLGGPLRDRTEDLVRERRRREELWAGASDHATVRTRPDLRRWLAELRAGGLARRLGGLDGEQRLLHQALDVLGALALAPGGVRLPVLARTTLGHSHGLDAGRPVATLVVRALAFLGGQPPPRGAAARRACWERAGVIVDDLSCDVLSLGVAPLGGGRIGDGLRAFAAAAEPVWITLRQLAAGDLTFPAGIRVRVCENPVVVAAAADLGAARSGPLVCLNGFPNQASSMLLGLLARQGAEIWYHGDFDWAGLRIANHLRQTVPFHPWRFTAPAYRQAVAALAPGAERLALGDAPTEAAWDDALGAAMRDAGISIEEEAVLGDLMTDLQAAQPAGSWR